MRKTPPLTPIKELKGLRFGRLLVLEFAYIKRVNKNSRTFWKCICDCGTTKLVRSDGLCGGTSTSCGCYGKEMRAKGNTVHGLSPRGKVMPEYRAWVDMKQRCFNKKSPEYHNYGGRGITVCDRWIESFENFLNDMGLRPSPKHSIDRFPDMNGNYCKENCRWATPKEQILNRRVTKLIEYNGEKLTVTDWSRKLGVTYEQVRNPLRWNHSIESICKRYGYPK